MVVGFTSMLSVLRTCAASSINKWFNDEIYTVCKAAKMRKGAAKAPYNAKVPLVKGLTSAQKNLAACLVATTKEGSCAGMGTLEEVRAAAADLPGVRRLLVCSPDKSPLGPVTYWGVNDRKNHKS
eukprot:4846316-Pyramimonas_sp.AAC.1